MDILGIVKGIRKTLDTKSVLDQLDERQMLYYFLLLNGFNIPNVITAKINNQELFDKNIEYCKNYFKSFDLNA